MKSRARTASSSTSAVYRGDAFERLLELSERSVDCVVTSPPYWGLRSYGLKHDDRVLDKWRRLLAKQPPTELHAADPRKVSDRAMPGYGWYRDHGGQLGAEPYPTWYVAHLVEILERIKPILKADGNLWVNIGDTYFARWSSVRNGRQGLAEESQRSRRRTPSGGWLVDKQLLLIPSRFAIGMQEAGWILRNDVIWMKPNPIPRPERDRLRLTHEHLFHFVLRPTQGRARYYYDMKAVEAGARDVVSVRPEKGDAGHSATFPVALVEPRIKSSSRPGGLVLDPFCGTGTTLAVAVRSGRKAIGIEKSPAFASAARRRLRAALEERPLRLVSGPPE